MSIELNPIANPEKIGGFNTNFQLIEDELNENVLRRQGLSPGEANHMEVSLDMNSNSILNVSTDTSDPGSLLSLGDADTRFVFVSGDTMTGNLSMGGFGVTNLRTPISSSEATRKDYVDSGLAGKVSKSGDSMSGDLNMVQNDINNIGTTRTGNLILNGVQVSPNELDESGVIWVKTLADLQALPTGGLVDGQEGHVLKDADEENNGDYSFNSSSGLWEQFSNIVGRRFSGCVIRSDGTQDIELVSVSGTFQIGETVTGGTSGATATVDSISGDVLTVSGVTGEFIAPIAGDASTETVTGGTSGASGTTDAVDIWRYIIDSNHAPFGFDEIDTNVTEQYALTVHRNKQTDSRVTAYSVTDETLALVGVSTGPSVNDNDVRLKMAAPLTGLMSIGTTPEFTNDEVSSFHASHTTPSWVPGNNEFTIDHLSCGLSGQMQVTYNYRAYTAVEEPFLPAVRRVNNTQKGIAQYMDLQINGSYDGSSWSISNREIGRNGGDETGYSISFASQTFTVTHPEIATREFDDDITITFYGSSGNSAWYIAKVLNSANRTSFEFQVYDVLAGSILSSVPTGLKFTAKRGMYRVPRPLGGHVSFSLPYTRVDPKDVVSGNGNIWIGSDERYRGS